LGVISAEEVLKNTNVLEEVFGPFSLVIQCETMEELNTIAEILPGQLTATILGEADELNENKQLLATVQQKVGRLLFKGVPTGVAVSPSMNHGGPFPASTDSRFTSVGTSSIERWLRPVCLQDCPQELLPEALKDENPLQIFRTLNKQLTKSIV
jgi:NADP-dependent aldehyde dehydrogenase